MGQQKGLRPECGEAPSDRDDRNEGAKIDHSHQTLPKATSNDDPQLQGADTDDTLTVEAGGGPTVEVNEEKKSETAATLDKPADDKPESETKREAAGEEKSTDSDGHAEAREQPDLSQANTGCVSKNLMLYKNARQTKPTFGKWSSLILLLQLSLEQTTKVLKNLNVLKLIIYTSETCFLMFLYC